MNPVNILSVFWQQNGVHMPVYLVRGAHNALVDTGPPQAEKDYLAEELDKAGLTPGHVGFALFTHAHADHMGGNAMLAAAGKTRFMIHEADAIRMEAPGLAYDRYQAPLLEALGKTPEEIADGRPPAQGMPVARKLKDGERIDLGGVSLTAIHLPGHTDGSMGFYLETEGVLLIGDSLAGLSSPGGTFPIITDPDAYLHSIERARSLPLSHIMGSHPFRGLHLPASTARTKTEIKEFLDDSAAFVHRLLETIDGLHFSPEETLYQKTDRVIAAMPEELGFLPLSQARIPAFSLTTVFWTLNRLGK